MNSPALQPPLLFISDVHLGGFSKQENQRIESELIQLVNYCQRNNIRLVILGDLFDYWMEYPNFVPKVGEKLLDRFKNFNRVLGPSLYITGNHDNWTLDHFQNVGFHVEHEQHTLSLADNSIMILHGDGLSKKKYNLPRPMMHRILRNASFVKLFQSLFPAQTGIRLMKNFSKFTRKFDEGPQKAKILNKWAQNHLKNNDIDIILCGHDHIPRRKQFTFGTYINLGTFYHHRTMAYYNNEDISLVCWKPATQSLTQFDTKIANE